MISQDGQNPQAGNEVQRLNGWKEIASYLGKGVRTVQRWETEHHLPIRRIGREGGEIVFAFKNEIDAWSEHSGRLRDVEREPEAVVAPVQTPTRYRRLAAAIALALVTFGGAYFSRARVPLLAAQPVAARIEFRSLVALTQLRLSSFVAKAS